MLRLIFDTEQIEEFKLDDGSQMIKIHQLIWIGYYSARFPFLGALKSALDIDIDISGGGDSFSFLAQRVEKSLKNHSFDVIADKFNNLVLPD